MGWTTNLRVLAATLAVAMTSALSLVLTAPHASAAVQEGIGRTVTPGQTYGGKPRSSDWLGSYIVGGRQVFCVSFALKAPNTGEQYKPGDELLTKWGGVLPTETAANISYLLLRYGDTNNLDEAAALAHLLHSWTAAPRPGHDDLNPANGFKDIGYDAPFHLAKLPAGAQQAVGKLGKDAEDNRGPWTTSVTPPTDKGTIGTAAEWTIMVKKADGRGIAGVPVALKAGEATLDDGTDAGTVTTGADGKATVKLTPSGAGPELGTSLSAPADKPYVRAPVTIDTQRVVSTGGEQKLTARGATTAATKPGKIEVAKTDAKTGKGIAGVALRLTVLDKATAATSQDGKSILGADGRPTVLTTASDGNVTVANIKTPQEICVVEVSPPAGYEHGFDPNNPPSVCGAVKAGETLVLALTNSRNEVPRAIPAGGAPTVLGYSATMPHPATGAVVGLSVFAILGSAFVGLVARRRFPKR